MNITCAIKLFEDKNIQIQEFTRRTNKSIYLFYEVQHVAENKQKVNYVLLSVVVLISSTPPAFGKRKTSLSIATGSYGMIRQRPLRGG